MIFHLRPISEYDLQQIKHINDLVQAVPWSLNALISEYEQNNPCSSVACDAGGRVIGYLFVRNVSEAYEIMSVGVLPQSQRQGVALGLIQTFLEQCPPPSIVFLEVSEQNLPAVKLYERLGFEVLSIRQGYYKDGSNALCMKLNLAKP